MLPLYACTLQLCLAPQLEQRIAANVAVARELVAQKKKERALLALKKKKLSENQLQSIQAYLMNVEDMVRGAQPVSWSVCQHATGLCCTMSTLVSCCPP